MLQTILILIVLSVSNYAIAEWEMVKNDSTVSFGTVKNETVSELHEFTSFDASVKDSGEAQFEIDLLSVDTNIEIRDERMRNILFTDSTRAIYTAQLKLDDFTSLPREESVNVKLEGTLEINGHSIELPLNIKVTSLTSGNYQVQSIGDNSVDVTYFGFFEGIEQLRGIAGLTSISTMVTFTFNIVFTPKQVP